MNYRLFFTIPLLFVPFLSFGQDPPKEDTLVIHLDAEIYTKTAFIDDNPRTKPSVFEYLVDKRNDKPLTGLYKVITGLNSFYYCRYKNGVETLELNYIEYHQDGKLVRMDIKSHLLLGSKYLSVPNYSCDKKIKGFYKSVISDAIVEEVVIKQKVKEDTVYWIVKSKRYPYKIPFEKHRLKGCF
ncbi:hypothetical protein AAG747_22840 [Rapidithrix thailandica]|uniref:Uncharacterized protein n=1 Tax=Rapidithrix thailandica TaxID=413964 RepID=A0AAW9SJA1_9BACT